MKTKQFIVKATFSDVLAKHAYQDTKVTAPGFGRAAKLGLTELLKREGVKRKRLRTIQLTIICTGYTTTDSDLPSDKTRTSK